MKLNPLRTLFLTPPFVQLNTPYPATTSLVGYLRDGGYVCFQRDLSIEIALEMLRKYGDGELTEEVIRFLQGKSPDEAETLIEPGYLPEGPSFETLAPEGSGLNREDVFAMLGNSVEDRAKLVCSLYLDDLASRIRDEVDCDFGFSKYAEHLGVSVPDFSTVIGRLGKKGAVDRLIERKVKSLLREYSPDAIGITIPFPGTLLGAFRIASVVRKAAPGVKLMLGGGYVSTELRDVDDARVYDYFDTILYDEGYGPVGECLDAYARGETPRVLKARPNQDIPVFVRPSYDGIDLSQYLNLVESANPMHRLWSDGRWLKIQLARGCYWHRCAFCDVNLDYIKCFKAPDAKTVVDAMERLASETGETGFHFTDEAIPPASARRLSEEILRRGFKCTWWGNVRFDRSYTPELADLMARAGCIAVTGGLECATDRLLALMSKGITLDSAKTALRNFSRAGILVHAYLMYAFPTQTRRDAMAALTYVRNRFREGSVQSAFFHRFALTVHSPIARSPEKFGIRIPPYEKKGRFALNEIGYEEPGAPDWDRIGKALRLALYNYMMGLGFDLPSRAWFDAVKA